MTDIVRYRSFTTKPVSARAVRCPLLVRLCCKSRKLQGSDFFAKTRNGKQSTIRIISIALPTSPVRFARDDEVPHIYTRKPRLQPAEFLITGAKRLLQHDQSDSDHNDAARRMTLSANQRHSHRSK